MEKDADCLVNLRWREILSVLLLWFEQKHSCKVVVQVNILQEVRDNALMSLERYGLPRPNVAKIAGVLSFWFRKLKPIQYAADTSAYYTAVNEYIGLMLGLAICEKYKEDLGNPQFKLALIPNRLIKDWVLSLRIHSHSPNSSSMSFELITMGKGTI